MTVIHNHPHPLAQQVISPTNPEIEKKYGRVRVEDWDDRVSGFTWTELSSRFDVRQYDTVAGRSLGAAADEIVRCHSLTDGGLVLLHNDWLPTSDQGSNPSE